MSEELVKRLRERCVFLFPHHGESRSYDADLMHEAADAIEELQKAIMRLEEESGILDELPMYQQPVGWIPVTERMPKEGEFVLVYGDLYPNKHDGGVIAVSKRMDWNYWLGFGRERNITHWMPLPEPPKDEKIS